MTVSGTGRLSVVHAANAVQSPAEPLRGIRELAALGYSAVEVDLWVYRDASYVFAHPDRASGQDPREFSCNDLFFLDHIAQCGMELVFLDIKYRELGSLPLGLLQSIAAHAAHLDHRVMLSRSWRLLEESAQLGLETAIVTDSLPAHGVVPFKFAVVPPSLCELFDMAGPTPVANMVRYTDNPGAGQRSCELAMVENPLLEKHAVWRH